MKEHPTSASLGVYDLTDFNNHRLSSAGELEVSNSFKYPIHIDVADNRLELTRMAVSPNEATRDHEETTDLYVLRNLTSDSPEARIIMDSRRRRLGAVALDGSEYTVYGRYTYIIGRALNATPELDLSSHASREHMHIRIGNMRGNLHFADLYSTNGTVVRLHPDDSHLVGHPTRVIVRGGEDNTLITYEESQQRWSRE